MNIVLQNKELTATINTKGAELISLKKNTIEYIWEGNPKFWDKHSPILFPIVGTLKNGEYNYADKQYGLSRHGFARDNDFHVDETFQNKAVFSFSSSEATAKQYPFDFELKVIYLLEEDNLTIHYEVTNNGASDMPFSIGGHPAFALTGNFENYSLFFENDESLISYSLENNLLSNRTTVLKLSDGKLPLNYSLFENDALIIKKLESKKIQILESNKPLLEVVLHDFPNLGIWTKNDAPFICLEPWFGYSDTLQSNGNLFEKEGIIILLPQKTFQASFNIKIY
ncbi:aldose 1-epimerase family protein [Flavobacterium microcysteis]|uniref:Aldose 1-epimerase family protein n=1 Tax=Flavobacterium microcysteis TaxID=2596891 RepID=A0A501QI54_9FLAO|nr:aldose 1-epimerase family protein [Flavobacterium microcysteis]TPD72132.1 aldose 1-epimerase family protein [Flavobacterium microcysteis]